MGMVHLQEGEREDVNSPLCSMQNPTWGAGGRSALIGRCIQLLLVSIFHVGHMLQVVTSLQVGSWHWQGGEIGGQD